MEEGLQHDPRTKSYIKDHLFDYLYTPVMRHYQERLDGIIIKNALALKSGSKHFVYRGELYCSDGEHVPVLKQRLLPSLYSTMDEYLTDVDQLNSSELPYVMGFINQVLNSSNSFQDYLKVLPDSVHGPLSNMIASCPCRGHKLDENTIQKLKMNNQMPIDLMKQRLLINLLF